MKTAILIFALLLLAGCSAAPHSDVSWAGPTTPACADITLSRRPGRYHASECRFD